MSHSGRSDGVDPEYRPIFVAVENASHPQFDSGSLDLEIMQHVFNKIHLLHEVAQPLVCGSCIVLSDCHGYLFRFDSGLPSYHNYTANSVPGSVTGSTEPPQLPTVPG